MRVFFTIVCLLYVNFNVKAQVNLAQGETLEKEYFTEIPFLIEGGKMIVHVEIEDKKRRFMFDTGAPNMIASHLLDSIKITPLRSLNISDSSNKRQKLGVYSIPIIKFGNVTFKNTPSLSFDYSKSLFSCYKIDGFIGSNMLRNSIVQIDFKKKVIKLTNIKNKLLLKKENATNLYLKLSQKAPYIKVNFKGEKGNYEEKLLIDTGANGFYSLSYKNFKPLNKKDAIILIGKSKGASSVGLFGSAKQKHRKRLVVKELEVASTKFKKFVTETSNDTNSKVGLRLLSKGIITLDFIDKKFYFDAYKNEYNLERKISGLKPTLVDGKLVIGFVWDKTLKNKVSYGDQIISVNSIDFSNFDTCEFLMSDFKFSENEELELVIKKKDGKEVTLNLKRELPKSLKK